MRPTADILRQTADYLTHLGLWTGPQFVSTDGALSITSAIYRAVTARTPDVFRTDEDQALRLITANADVMRTIWFLSCCLDTEAPTNQHTGLPDHIEHIERYAAEPAPGTTEPPTVSEVIGRILRAAATADDLSGHRAA